MRCILNRFRLKSTDAPDLDPGVLDSLKEKFADFFNKDGKASDEEAQKVLEELGKMNKEAKEKDQGTIWHLITSVKSQLNSLYGWILARWIENQVLVGENISMSFKSSLII